jgi:hypothetical protein
MNFDLRNNAAGFGVIGGGGSVDDGEDSDASPSMGRD